MTIFRDLDCLWHALENPDMEVPTVMPFIYTAKQADLPVPEDDGLSCDLLTAAITWPDRKHCFLTDSAESTVLNRHPVEEIESLFGGES